MEVSQKLSFQAEEYGRQTLFTGLTKSSFATSFPPLPVPITEADKPNTHIPSLPER